MRDQPRLSRRCVDHRVEEGLDVTVVRAIVPDTRPPVTDVAPAHTRRQLHLVLLGMLASLPLIVGAVVDAINGWLPAGDRATIVLRARDVFSRHMPLVGQYSEISAYVHGNHAVFAPGPMLYWLLAIPAQTTRWLPAAPLLWMAIFQSIVVLAVVWIADRLGGHVLAAGVALGVVMLAGSVGPRPFYDPWSAYAPILPLVLLTFLTAAVVAGRWRLLPLVALVASFEVQTDPSFAIVTAALALVAICGWVVERRRALARSWPTLGLTAAVVIVCWLPAIVQQLTTSPGNLTLLWRAVHGEGRRDGLGFGFTILAKAVAGWPFEHFVHVTLQGGSHVSAKSVVGGLLVLAVLCGLVVWAIGMRRRNIMALTVTTLALSIGIVVAAAAIPDDKLGRESFWLLYWTRGAAMVVWVVVAWCAWLFVTDKQLFAVTAPSRLVVAGTTTLVVVASIVVAVFGRRADVDQWAYPAIRRATAVIEQRPGHGPYVVSAAMWPLVPLIVGQGLVQQLDARGYTVGANNGFEHNLGLHHRLPSGTPDLLVTGDLDPYGFAHPPIGATPLAVMPVQLWEHGHQVVVRVSLREPK